MTSTLIQNASAMLTGSPEPQAHTRATDLRIEGDRITEMGSLTPRAGETVVDARGCVVYPGFVNTHHHLFQSVLKGVPAGLNVPLFEWLQSVPYRYGPYLGEEAIEIAATIGNAKAYLAMQAAGEDFSDFVWGFVDGEPIRNTYEDWKGTPAKTPLSEAMSAALKKRGFKFVGPVIVYAWMQAVGIVNDHGPACFRHAGKKKAKSR